MFNFDFLEKGLGIVSLQDFLNDFFKKIFLHYILLTDQISLSDCLLEILGSMCIAIICFPSCDIINFEINHIFLIRLFSAL